MVTRKRKLDSQMAPAPPSSPPELPRKRVSTSPEFPSDTMAPPESGESSSESAQKKPRKSRRDAKQDKASHLQSKQAEGDHRESIGIATRWKRQRNGGGKEVAAGRARSISTAALQDLLPRRRRRRRGSEEDGFDIHSSSDGEGLVHEDRDYDELSRPPLAKRSSNIRGKARQTPNAAANKALNTGGKHSKPFPALRQVASTSRARRRVQKPKGVSPDTQQSPLPQTYGGREGRRRTSSGDQENSHLDSKHNDSLEPVESEEEADSRFFASKQGRQVDTKPGKDLKRAARKFKEVDQWELDFEEVSVGSSGRSSQVDAR